MDETDQAIERSKMVQYQLALSYHFLSPNSSVKVELQVVEQTVDVGAQTAANLKGQVSGFCNI